MVYLASHSGSVVDLFCVWSQSFFFYRFLKRFKGLFLETFLDSRYQHWLYLAEKAENWEFV